MADLFWKVITTVCLGGILFVVYSISTGRSFLERLIPEPTITQTANLTVLKVQRESQLVTTSAFVQAVVRQKDEQWYGKAEVIRIVPATVFYAVDLAGIDRNAMEYDATAKLLYVPLPDVKVQSIDIKLDKAELIKSIDFLRTEAGTVNRLEETTDKMIRPAVEKMGDSPEVMKMAKDQAIASVKQLLEAALDAAGARVKVVPYFKSEGKKALA